jgi:hypothetical protein
MFIDDDGQTYLFFQANNDHGKTWFLSFEKIGWKAWKRKYGHKSTHTRSGKLRQVTMDQVNALLDRFESQTGSLTVTQGALRRCRAAGALTAADFAEIAASALKLPFVSSKTGKALAGWHPNAVVRLGHLRKPGAMQDLVQHIYETALWGEKEGGRHWYRDSAKRDVAGFAKRENVTPVQAAQLLAIYSAQTNPTENMRLAALAARQWHDAKKITVKSGAQNANAMRVMRGMPWELKDTNLKTSNYWQNLLQHIVPKKDWKAHGIDQFAATNDRWVSTMFQRGKKGVKIDQADYPIMTHIFQGLGKKMGWLPQEVQAASWVIYKAKDLMVEQPGVYDTWEKAIEEARSGYKRGYALTSGPVHFKGNKFATFIWQCCSTNIRV